MIKKLKIILSIFVVSNCLFSCGNSSKTSYDSSFRQSLEELDLINMFLNKKDDEVYKIPVENEEYNDTEYHKDTSNKLYNLLCKINYELIDKKIKLNVNFDESEIIYKTNECAYTVYLFSNDDLYGVSVNYKVTYNAYTYGTYQRYKVTSEDYQNIMDEISIIKNTCWCEA